MTSATKARFNERKHQLTSPAFFLFSHLGTLDTIDLFRKKEASECEARRSFCAIGIGLQER